MKLIFRQFEASLSLKSLKEMTISTNLGDAATIGKAIKKLEKLEKLTVYIQRYDKASVWDDSFPFNDLKIIKELTVIILPDFKSKEWGVSLSNDLPNLKNLEALKICDKSDGMMLLKALNPLINSCKFLKNIKSVHIESEMKSLLLEKRGLLVEELEVCIRQKEEEVLHKALVSLNELTSSNKFLRSFYIGGFNGFDHTAIKY